MKKNKIYNKSSVSGKHYSKISLGHPEQLCIFHLVLLGAMPVSICLV